MQFLADILLGAGAIGAAAYCFVLSVRLRRLKELDGGMGAAVALLSKQVDELNTALLHAKSSADTGAASLRGLTERAETVAERMELMLAAMHDLPEAPGAPPPAETPEATFLRHAREARSS